MKISLGYITCPTKAEAKNIVLALLEEKLIACANIIPSAESYFVWDDEIQMANESVIIFKTKQKNEDKIIRFVRHVHSYEVPCIVFMPLDNGNPEFLKWVEESC